MTDVLMILDENGGDIVIDGRKSAGGPYSGEVRLTDGPETDFLHALFGGQQDPEWWGNLIGDVSYKSRTQDLVRTLSLTSGNLIRVQAAIEKDLEDAGYADFGDVEITIPQPNRINFQVGDVVIERDWL